MRPKTALPIVGGAILLWTLLNTLVANSPTTLALSCAFVGFAAAWIVGRRGPLVGPACVLGAIVLWSVQVLTRFWLSGDLARSYPDCDPCGLYGYIGRLMIVGAMGLGTFGVVALFAGWLGAFARQRVSARSPQRS